MKQRRLLIVSFAFAPSAVIGAKRPTRLAMRIGEQGWSPFVLTTQKRCHKRLDTSSTLDELPDIFVEKVACMSPWWHASMWTDYRQLGLRYFWRVNRLWTGPTARLLSLDPLAPWIWRATSSGVRFVEEHKIDMIWATTPPLSNLVVARQISRKTGVPYVVDFRDVRNVSNPKTLRGSDRRSFEAEKEAVENAAGITHVAPDQIDALQQMYPGCRQTPHRLIYNWFDRTEGDDMPARDFGRPTMLYGGNLYGGTRRVDGLLEALKQHTQRDNKRTESLQLVLHCPVKDRPSITQLVDRFRLDDVIRLEGLIPASEFQAASRGADILLIVVGHNVGAAEHAKAIPGKLFDYLAAGRPILAVGPEGCVAGQMVEELNRGIWALDDQPKEIAHAIDLLLDGRGREGPLDLSPEAVSEFEGPSAVARLAEFLRHCLARDGSSR